MSVNSRLRFIHQSLHALQLLSSLIVLASCKMYAERKTSRPTPTATAKTSRPTPYGPKCSRRMNVALYLMAL
jgi:hypothetical protein